MTRISVGTDNVLWGLRENEKVEQYFNNQWHPLEGRFTELAALDRGIAWATNKFGHVYRFSNGHWHRINGSLEALSASRNNQQEFVWGYDLKNNIKLCTYDARNGNCQWQTIDKSPTLQGRRIVSIATTGDGKGYGLFEPRDQIGYPTYVFDNGQWVKLGESLLHLVGTVSNYITGVNSKGEVRMTHMSNLNDWIVLDGFQTVPECSTISEQIWVLAGAYAQLNNNTVTYEHIFETVA
ncbi:hypothetical protein K493DRAFT_346216 [Basidiobolus meristosporus CBS 931.73]|uniref:Uncharacterized protein n=1 Tax=Basidiobolus meristosporus CBS 931.73 TaxID=1314790 RepID=A0A1Y1Z0B0_9FUNG|nr:hypothetical protein K493DRAFT_346216 [Basidiobolus meristosporus CBS 931.73]|eukprot:ORY03377.1 hypothetical protein K493DRAFT_346216 [Basidiobolus meristosporus CBS 931.73]